MAFVPVMLAVTAAGAAVSAIGAIKQGQAAATAANYNRRVNENNATAAEQQAQSLAMIHQRRASMTNGALLANTAANGIETGEGTALDMLAQSAAAAEMDRQNIVYNGRVKATGLRNQANLDAYQADTATQNGYLSAAGSLLKSGASAYGAYGSSLSTASGGSGSIPFNASKSAALYGD